MKFKSTILLVLSALLSLLLFSIIISGCPGKHRIIKEKVIDNALRGTLNYIYISFLDQQKEQQLLCITNAVSRVFFFVDAFNDHEEGHVCINPHNAVWVNYITNKDNSLSGNTNIIIYWSEPLVDENTGVEYFLGYCDGQLDYIKLSEVPLWKPILIEQFKRK